jgi:hypothetical protein
MGFFAMCFERAAIKAERSYPQTVVGVGGQRTLVEVGPAAITVKSG